MRISRENLPVLLYYAPLLPGFVFLCLKHGGPRAVFTSNPGIPFGGAFSSSKSAFSERAGSSFRHPKSCLIRRAGDDFTRINNFFAETRVLDSRSPTDYSWPRFLLKPDAGERGRNVSVYFSEAAARAAIARVKEETLLQEYVVGIDYSVFFFRNAQTRDTQILAITERSLPSGIGNGADSVEEMIIKSNFRPDISRKLLKINLERLAWRPKRGQIIQLSFVANHSQGAIFKTVQFGVITESLTGAVGEVADVVEGVYYGRYDFKASSLENLMSARDVHLLEFNGAYAEPLEIYDSNCSLFHMYCVLHRRLDLLMSIGAELQRQGYAPPRWKDVLAAFRHQIKMRFI